MSPAKAKEKEVVTKSKKAVRKKMRMIQASPLRMEEKNALTSFAPRKKSTRRSDPRLKWLGIASSARTVTKTTSTTISVNIVNKFIPISMKMKIKTNG